MKADRYQVLLRRAAVVSLGGALLLGLFLRFHALTDVGLGGSDTVYYTSIAKSWSDGDFVYGIAEGTTYRPLAFLFYGLAIRLFGYQDYSIKMANSAFDCANVLLIFLICFVCSREVWLSLSCAAVYALSPWAIHYARRELVHTLGGSWVLLSFLFFVLHDRAVTARARISWLVLSSVAVGLASLTHEELLLITGGYLLYLLIRQLPSWNMRVFILRASVYVSVTLLVCHRMIRVAWERFHQILTAPIDTSGGARLGEYLERLARFTWNFVVGNSSPSAAYLTGALIVCWVIAAMIRLLRKSGDQEARLPGPCLLAVLVVTVYVVAYSLIFSRSFPRLFVALQPLLLIAVALGYSRLFRGWLSPGFSQAAASGLLFLTTPFNVMHYAEYRGREYHRNSDLWAPASFVGEQSLREAVSSMRSNYTTPSWARSLYDSLSDKVNPKARLLVTSSIMYPYPGRRALQVGFYFGDNAVYVIDHQEPLDELISRYSIRYVLISNFHADRRIENRGKLRRYLYRGQWSEPEPLILGASYGFKAGQYSLAAEQRFLTSYLEDRGARVLFADGKYRRPGDRQGFPSEVDYSVYALPTASGEAQCD